VYLFFRNENPVGGWAAVVIGIKVNFLKRMVP
jgi:hypothetical protein